MSLCLNTGGHGHHGIVSDRRLLLHLLPVLSQNILTAPSLLGYVRLPSQLAHGCFNKIYLINDFGDLSKDCGITFLALLDLLIVLIG